MLKRQHNDQQEKTTQWPTRKDNTMTNKKRQHNDLTRKDNTMTNKKRQHNDQQEMTTQWPTRKDAETNNDLQNITQKTNDRALRTSLRSVGELKYSGKMWQIERNDAQ
jgi:hypothetical protein